MSVAVSKSRLVCGTWRSESKTARVMTPRLIWLCGCTAKPLCVQLIFLIGLTLSEVSRAEDRNQIVEGAQAQINAPWEDLLSVVGRSAQPNEPRAKADPKLEFPRGNELQTGRQLQPAPNDAQQTTPPAKGVATVRDKAARGGRVANGVRMRSPPKQAGAARRQAGTKDIAEERRQNTLAQARPTRERRARGRRDLAAYPSSELPQGLTPKHATRAE
jgi:hypothetical protein